MATELNGLGKVLFAVFRVLWTSLVIIVPALGVWIASSLAAYQNGPVWLVCIAGLLLFPGLPGLWEILHQVRQRKKTRRWHRQVLTTWDRMVLRTLAINLLFLVSLMWARPEAIFTALSSRGDWPLENLPESIAADLRPLFLGAADGLQWLYEAAHDNEFEEMIDDEPADRPTPTPSPSSEDDPWRDPFLQPTGAEASKRAVTVPKDISGAATWPSPELIHPAVTAMPESAKESVQSVGEYLAAAESDPYRRVKAIHDFTATHVAYDAPALAQGRYPDQSAATVLRTGVGVCAGYANLMLAIGDVTGDEIVVVVGDSRKRGGEIAGGGHAWNAAKIDDAWYLLDPTWDSGHVRDGVFVPEYSTNYLFPPPAIMGITHHPDVDEWQLRETPQSRGEFTRQPMMRPSFFAQGFTLIAPTRSQITVDEDVELRLGNTGDYHLMAKASPAGGGAQRDCEVRGDAEVRVFCPKLSAGTYNIQLFSGPEAYGSFQLVGEVQANVRG